MKRSKDTIRGFVLGAALTALVAAAPTAAAAVGKRAIEVVYSDIRLVVDGKEVIPKDANGNVVEPFSYEGTTYLPVRAAVNAITGGSKSVDWDQNTHTIYIGGRPAAELVDMSTLKSYPDNKSVFTTNYSFVARQQTYSPFNALLKHTTTFLLSGNYTTFQASVAVPDTPDTGTRRFTVTISNTDTKEVLETVSLNRGDAPIDISLDVTGIDKITIAWGYRSIADYENPGGPNPGILYNATLTPIPQR